MDLRTDTWLLALRGVVAVAFGVLAIVWPGLTVVVLALLFGAFVLVDGVATLIGGFRSRQDAPRRVARIVIGLLSVAAGLIALIWPDITALILVFLVGAWAVVTGVLGIAAATQVPGGWWLIVVGVAALIAGVLIMVNPRAGAVAIGLVIGIYAIVAGVIMLVASWRLHRLTSGSPGGRPASAGA
jgi:uncharacterized membrane protein HdeD (DUF308 family)